MKLLRVESGIFINTDKIVCLRGQPISENQVELIVELTNGHVKQFKVGQELLETFLGSNSVVNLVGKPKDNSEMEAANKILTSIANRAATDERFKKNKDDAFELVNLMLNASPEEKESIDKLFDIMLKKPEKDETDETVTMENEDGE